MKQQQRRVFLKVIAVSPLIGCGPDPSAPRGLGGSAGAAAGGTSQTGGNSSVGGAGSSSVGGGGNSALGGAGNPALGGAGNSAFGGSSSAGGVSAGGGTVASGGQSGAHAAAGASPGGGSAAGGDPNNPETPIGNVSAYPLGSFSIAGTIFFLGHDAGGLYAMSMQCTHAGCACTMKGSELNCPCHGSRFDHLGNVLQGPATKPLPHYPVFVDATGNITVDRFTVVGQSARTPV